MSKSWKHLSEAEVLRYTYDSKACMRRLDDVLAACERLKAENVDLSSGAQRDALVRAREVIDGWKNWHRKLAATLGLKYVETTVTHGAVHKLAAENARMRGQLLAIREVASVDVGLLTDREMTEVLSEILSHTNDAAEAAGGTK